MVICKDCKSIVSRTKSVIGETNCNSDCPTDVTCEDILPSNCVFYSGANLSCSGVVYGESLTSALIKLDAKICESASSGCLFKISSNDTCCGYFQTKILTGAGIVFTVANEGGCETLTISEGCYTWTDILPSSASGTGKFRNGWFNVDASGASVQKSQFSSVKECTVRLRGYVKLLKPYDNNKALIEVLPTGFTPPVVRSFATVVRAGTQSLPAFIRVYSTGEVLLTGLPSISGDVDLEVSLDGIFFEVV